MSYQADHPMIAAASHKPALWRLVAGAVTAILLTLVWLAAIILAAGITQGGGFRTGAGVLFGGPATSPARSVLYLLIVGGLGLGTLAAARFWQGRRRADLIGRGARVLRHFAIAMIVTFIAAAVLFAGQIAFDDGTGPVRNLPVADWLSWLPFALIALAFQTGAEELFFRGYLQSQLAARFRSPAIWLVLPAIAFGFAHFAPTLPPQNAVLYVGFAALFGILAGDLTARTGSLGAAWGWHFANNTLAVLIVATEGSLTGLALWKTTDSLLEPIAFSPWLVMDVGIVLVVWVAIRRALGV